MLCAPDGDAWPCQFGHTGLSILVQLWSPPCRSSVTPGCRARCKLTAFVLRSMFYFHTTRIAYYLTSSTGERRLGLGAPPSPLPVKGGHWRWILGLWSLEGCCPALGIIPRGGSQLLSAHAGDNSQGSRPHTPRLLHFCTILLCGLGEVIWLL